MAFNIALTMLMVWLGMLYLRRYNPDPVAALFSAGFFLLSVGFAYVFWIHPEVFNMAGVTVCLYLGLVEPGIGAEARAGGRSQWRRLADRLNTLAADPTARALVSGAALTLAVYHKPMLGILALPVLFAYWQRRQLKSAVSWCAGFALAMALIAGIAVALTGHPTAYLGMARGGYKVCSPNEMPIQPAVIEEAPSAPEEPAGELTSAPPEASWYWIFRIPRLHPKELLERFGYFLWGRHTGLFLYFPFALLALILFLLHARRDALRRVVLASLAGVALTFLLWIPFNWHGGGGFVGNRYFVNAYPGFLFLVTRIAPSWLHLVGYALGGADARAHRVQSLGTLGALAHPPGPRPQPPLPDVPFGAPAQGGFGLRGAHLRRRPAARAQRRLLPPRIAHLAARRHHHRSVDPEPRSARDHGLRSGELPHPQRRDSAPR